MLRTANRPGRRFDHVFFSSMALVIRVTVFVGFALTYSLARLFRAPLPSPIIHVHGAVSSCWLLLLVAQTSLVSSGRVDIHRRLGVAGFVLMALFGFVEAHSMGISDRRILGWLPWILSFVLANGFFEELMNRGLFLGKFEPLLGAPFSNLLTAFVFAIGHAGVRYSADVLWFVVMTFVLAMIWGYLKCRKPAHFGARRCSMRARILCL